MKLIFTFIVILCLIVMVNMAVAQEVKINSNLVIEADGTIRMDNAATVWDDIMVFPDAISRDKISTPIWGGSGGNLTAF